MRTSYPASNELALVEHPISEVYQHKPQKDKVISLTSFAEMPATTDTSPRGIQIVSEIRDVLYLLLSSLVVISISVLTLGTVHDKNASHYTVQAGDSLWSIASKEDPHDSRSAVVDWMIRQNHLQSNGKIYPGEPLKVPLYRPVG